MVKKIHLVIGVIPALFAILIMIPLITQTEIPTSAVVPSDRIYLEYAKHDIKTISFGVTERIAAQNSEILTIKNDGTVTYSEVKDGKSFPEIRSDIDKHKVKKLTAMIKETGFMAIERESFPVNEGVLDYKKHSLKVTLNGHQNQIYWPEQDVTEKFIPPIITMVESELSLIMNEIKND